MIPKGETSTSTKPELPGLKGVSLLRFLWRQFTSMRTALILLVLLAIAAVPGSLLPQRGQNPVAVNDFINSNKALGKIFDSLRLFDVFASAWFGAIYILLFASLIGCVLPRTFEHLKNIKQPPPRTPTFLNKMEFYQKVMLTKEGLSNDAINKEVSNTIDENKNNLKSGELKSFAIQWFKKNHFRLRIENDSISAEKGYLREAGNLLFHLSLIFILIGLASGSFLSLNGSAIVNVGENFLNVPTSYDQISYGRLRSGDALNPFLLEIKDFKASYNITNNAPNNYELKVIAHNPFSSAGKPVSIKVNSPLTYGATKIYLQANGYSPVVTVRDKNGKITFNGPTVFLPQDGNLTSAGAIKLPDMGSGIGFVGTFVPTYAPSDGGPIKSVFPAAYDPRLLLGVWEGNLGLDSGVPQSIYRLDTSKMRQIGLTSLKLGAKYDFGVGTITFDKYVPWVNLQIVTDPGKYWAFFGALFAILGLLISLFGNQRRIWVRVLNTGELEVAGLEKNKVATLEKEIASLLQHLTTQQQ